MNTEMQDGFQADLYAEKRENLDSESGAIEKRYLEAEAAIKNLIARYDHMQMEHADDMHLGQLRQVLEKTRDLLHDLYGTFDAKLLTEENLKVIEQRIESLDAQLNPKEPEELEKN